MFSVVVFQSQEAQLKKKLQMFLSEMLKMGTVKGFKYFAMYMRGREEMVLSVVNQPQVCLCFLTLERSDSVVECLTRASAASLRCCP